jgi:hypothetical protein
LGDRASLSVELDHFKVRCREFETRIHAIGIACNDAVRIVGPPVSFISQFGAETSAVGGAAALPTGDETRQEAKAA